MTDIIEQFHGVYLLYCQNPKYEGRVYVGYTVDPNRRIKQHNAGKQSGGAWKTSNKGPWTMVLIVHGFPNDISALRFEWAWQHPHSSRRLKDTVPKKKHRERVYDYTIRVLEVMLQTGPWNRLPLTLRWLNEGLVRDLSKSPPLHMPICYGPVVARKQTVGGGGENAGGRDCHCCGVSGGGTLIGCLNPGCDAKHHVICLSAMFLGSSKSCEYIPIEGACPSCRKSFLWGDLIRKHKGCYKDIDVGGG